MPSFQLQPGDRIAYSAAFLRSIGCQTGELPAARGTVEAIENLGSTQLARIAWDRPDNLPQRVAVANLAKVGANSRFCSC